MKRRHARKHRRDAAIRAETNGNRIAWKYPSADASTLHPREGTRVKLQRRITSSLSLVILGFLALAVSIPAHATDIWTDWNTPGYVLGAGINGQAYGYLNGSEVHYVGDIAGGSDEKDFSIAYAGTVGSDYPGESTATWNTSSTGTWDTSSSTTFGGATNAPPTSNNSVPVTGGYTDNEWIEFGTTVTDPLIAIWSLGSSSTPASFDFINAKGIELLFGGADGYIGYAGEMGTRN